MPENPRWFSPPMYGMKSYGDLFTPRQLVALTTFSDLVQEAREKAIADAKGLAWRMMGWGSIRVEWVRRLMGMRWLFI